LRAGQLGQRARAVAAASSALPLKVLDVPTGGGTDAAFAAVKARGPVIEGLGLSGAGSHSNLAEYVKLDSIVPRLYLSTRLIMDVSGAKVR
jgi:glutamate carboxypeptidase